MTSVGAETGVKAGIVLATYNGAQFLPEQLQSFLTQERLPDELLVSDDASTDDTLAIVEGFARKAPFPVRVSINPERLGFIQNFAKALALSDADVIFMSDQDDVWFPAKLATMLAAVEVHPDKLLFVCDAELVEEDLSPTGLTIFGQKNPDAGAERSSTYGCCFAMRREILDYVLPIPDGYDFHDKWMAHLAKDLGVLRAVDVPLQQYRRHGSQRFVDHHGETGGPARQGHAGARPGGGGRAFLPAPERGPGPAQAGADWSGWRRRGSLTAAPWPWTWPARPRA